MVKIISAEGIEKDIACIGCALQSGEIKYVGEKVIETKHFEVSQDYEIPIPGFMILSTKKHLKGIEDFSEEIRKEYVDLLYNIRRAMTKALHVEYVYFIQEEDTIAESSHFHVWLFPRWEWMKQFGRGIRSVKPLMEHAREKMKTKENLMYVKEATKKIKECLA
jgi:diadenosine tetraphosphate (Ap4A) HIT family hydrolase